MKLCTVLIVILTMTLALFAPSEARYYQPETGRYLTADPIGLEGGIDPFVYVDNNPVNRIDPDGDQTIPYPVYPPYAPAIPAPGPVIVPAIIAGGYIIVGGIIIMLAPTKIACDEEIAIKMTQREDVGGCDEHYVRCAQTGLASKPGDAGQTRCETCRDKCLRRGGWPGSYETVGGRKMCNYGKYPRAR